MTGLLTLEEKVPGNFEAFIGMPRQILYRELAQGLPEGTKVDITADRRGYIEKLTIHGEGFKFHREFSLRKKTVHHDHDNVSDTLRDMGIGRTINRNLFLFYEKIGIENITIEPERIGTYAWARMGCIPTAYDWRGLVSVAHRRLNFLQANPCPTNGPIPEEKMAALRATLRETDPRSFWKIVDDKTACYGMTLGKILTLPLKNLPRGFSRIEIDFPNALEYHRWKGGMSLKDEACMARARKYLRLQTHEKPAPKNPHPLHPSHLHA